MNVDYSRSRAAILYVRIRPEHGVSVSEAFHLITGWWQRTAMMMAVNKAIT
jgi:hypothetical protein